MQNETIPFILPYRMRFFFNIPDTRTYVLLYLSQSPMLYYYYCHTISVCFLCTLIVHVCGELSILAYRVRNINESSSSIDKGNSDIALRNFAIEHQKIIRQVLIFLWLSLCHLLLTLKLLYSSKYCLKMIFQNLFSTMSRQRNGNSSTTYFLNFNCTFLELSRALRLRNQVSTQ